MHIDPLERKWMYVIGIMTLIMVGSMTYAAVVMNTQIPGCTPTQPDPDHKGEQYQQQVHRQRCL